MTSNHNSPGDTTRKPTIRKNGADQAIVYTASSCHEVGYRWRIHAPANLPLEPVERLQKALAFWSDEPKQEHLNDLLDDPYTLEDYELSGYDQQLLRQVRFEVSSVHRDVWCQDLKQVEGSRDE